VYLAVPDARVAVCVGGEDAAQRGVQSSMKDSHSAPVRLTHGALTAGFLPEERG
jgi:hypothetical protein